jgi:hypothetical protein
MSLLDTEGFQVSSILRRWWLNGKRRIERRLDKTKLGDCEQPMFTASNIHYEPSQRCRGMSFGGIGAMHLLARRIGLIDDIDRRLVLLQIHLPYHESDHVLNFAYNALCGGEYLDDMEMRRHDEGFLDALGTRRTPDPTTAGDFCRRFQRYHVDLLQDIFDDARLRVWKQQPRAFFDEARLDFDGHLVGTTGECKEGMSLAYDGTWGYHPLVVSLANTQEVLRIVNRAGNRPSHEGAAAEADRAIALCLRAGFRRVLLRGDTDFSQSEQLDRWDATPGVQFIFGYNAMANLIARAEELPKNAWKKLERPPRYTVHSEPRERPANVKERVVREQGYKNQRLEAEHVAEFEYRPTACSQSYRMVVVRKQIVVEKGQQRLFDDVRYFFYITNDRKRSASEIVFLANDRCNQENLIEQLSNGVRALRAPVGNLESNWSYMVMTALAWNLKAWMALSLPQRAGRWQERHREEKHWVLGMEFKQFMNAFIRIPCQIVRTGRKLVYRLCGWNPWQPVLFRLLGVLRC